MKKLFLCLLLAVSPIYAGEIKGWGGGLSATDASTTYVPYIGATSDLNLGAKAINSTSVTASSATINNASATQGLLIGNLTRGSGESSKGGIIAIQGGSNGAETVNGLEFKASASASGFGYKIYPDTTIDKLVIATRYNSATWTNRLTLGGQTGALSLLGNSLDSGSLTASSATITGTLNSQNVVTSTLNILGDIWTDSNRINMTTNLDFIHGGTGAGARFYRYNLLRHTLGDNGDLTSTGKHISDSGQSNFAEIYSSGTIQSTKLFVSSAPFGCMQGKDYGKVTTINTIDTYVSVATTMTLCTTNSWFNLDVSSLVYNDTMTRRFNVTVSGYASPVAGTEQYEFALFRNGVLVNEYSKSEIDFVNGAVIQVFHILGGISLSQGDRLDLRVKDLNGTNNIIVKKYTVTCHSVQ